MMERFRHAGGISADRQLDCRGMSCPLPVMCTRRELAQMRAGETLMVVATDPASVDDITELSLRSQAALVAHHEDGGDFIFLLRKL